MTPALAVIDWEDRAHRRAFDDTVRYHDCDEDKHAIALSLSGERDVSDVSYILEEAVEESL